MRLVEFVKLNDKYMVKYKGVEMTNFEALAKVKAESKIVYFKDKPNFKKLGVKDNLKKEYDQKTIVYGFFDVIIKNGDYYNIIVIVKSYLGLKSIIVGLLDKPTIIKNEEGKIIDIIL